MAAHHSPQLSPTLENPWPPTPPGASTSDLSVYSGEDHDLMVAAGASSSSSKIVRVYGLNAGNTPLQVMIMIIPTPNKPNHHTFSLSFKAGGIHRSLCSPVTLQLAFDPRKLDFSVFIFPPKSSLPKHCLYSLRVWLRHDNIDHRIFAEDALWVGTDLDFETIPDASFARLLHSMPDLQCYETFVGRAPVRFIVKWKWLKESVYSFSFEYEAGGVGRTLFDNLVLRLDCPPHQIGCHIYTIPLQSNPPGATHRLRVWLKSASVFNTEDDFYQSHTYQRIWIADDFRVGMDLNFSEIDRKVVVGQLINPANYNLRGGLTQ